MKINVLHVTILHRRLLKQLKQKCELFHSLHSSVIVCLICFWIIFEIKQMSYSFKFHPSKLYLLFTYLLRDLGLLPENFFNSDKFLLMFLELEIVKFKFCRRNLFACNGETSLEGTFFIRAQIYDKNFLCLSVTRLTIIGTVVPDVSCFGRMYSWYFESLEQAIFIVGRSLQENYMNYIIHTNEKIYLLVKNRIQRKPFTSWQLLTLIFFFRNSYFWCPIILAFIFLISL
jgi:hypothetical protein